MQKDSFRDAMRSLRSKCEGARTRHDALTSKKEPATCSDPLSPEAAVKSIRSVDRDEKIRNEPRANTSVTSAVDAVVASAIDVERVACGGVEVSTGVQLSRKCRKNQELLVKHISQVKAFKTAAQQPYVRSVDSKGNLKMLFCDTGNNAASVMASDRFEIELEHNLGRFSEVVWYDRKVQVQGIERGSNQISMVGAVGQTLYEPGTKRPLRIWTQLVKNCDTGTADVMLGSKIVRNSEWDAEADVGDEEF